LISLPKDISEAVEQGLTVVVQSRQRAQALRLAHAASALASEQRVWATPDVLPFEAWLARELERRAAAGTEIPRLLSPAEEWFLWRQATAQLTHELDLISRGPLSDALRQSSRLALEYGIDIAALRGAVGTEERLLHDVDRLVRARAQALGADIAAHLADGCVGGERPVLIAGVARPSPHLARLISARADAGCATQLRELTLPARSAARAIVADDTDDELERIAEWCRERVQREPAARLLVILPGAAEARERLTVLIRQSVDPRAAAAGDLLSPQRADIVSIEGGVPLSRAPLVAHALDSLSWLAGEAEFADVSAWLCAPYWLVPDTQRARLDLWLRDHASLELDPPRMLSMLGEVPESLRPVAQALSTHIRSALQQLGTGNGSPRHWSERFRDALTTLGWPGTRTLDSDAEQTRARFTELLDDFGQLAVAAPSIAREHAIALLRELAARTAFRPASGDPLVTVSPSLADPIVRYDGIWVAGLHADAWPQPVQPDAFLPLAAQIAAGVPAASANGRAEEARALMAAWQASTGELVLSAPSRADDVELSLSPLLVPLVVPTPERPPRWLALRLHRDGQTQAFEDPTGVRWNPSLPLPSGTRSVELQNLCPFRAYAELRLGGADLGAPEPGVAPDVRGKLLHAALEALWRVLGSSRKLLETSTEQLDALIAKCVDDAARIAFGPRIRAFESPAQARESLRTRRLIRALCELEKQRSPFSVKATELARTFQLGEAQLRVRIDRIDALEAGGTAILDYKSGKPVTGDWDSERPTHPQLLAYLAAVSDDVRALATVNVTVAKGVRFAGVAAQSDILPNVRSNDARAWELRRNEWIGCVERLASEFLAGRAVVDPMPGACDYCEIKSVCRIADRGPDAPEAIADE
jgi:ATP-dependent helicase/nuclease subunit B